VKRAALFVIAASDKFDTEPIAPKVVFFNQTDEKTNFPIATPQSLTNLVATIERLPACCGTFCEPHAVPKWIGPGSFACSTVRKKNRARVLDHAC
jgi:hypothetical protein